jgi:hypothetical protein
VSLHLFLVLDNPAEVTVYIPLAKNRWQVKYAWALPTPSKAPGNVLSNRFRLSTFLPNSDTRILSSDRHQLGRRKAFKCTFTFRSGE